MDEQSAIRYVMPLVADALDKIHSDIVKLHKRVSNLESRNHVKSVLRDMKDEA